MVVEFRDCRIYLNGVSPMDELYQYGTDENGNPLTKHMAYIDARAEMRDADKNLYYVNAVQPEKGREGSSKDPLKTVYAMADMAGADKYNAGELAGFKAVYQEGESGCSFKAPPMDGTRNLYCRYRCDRLTGLRTRLLLCRTVPVCKSRGRAEDRQDPGPEHPGSRSNPGRLSGFSSFFLIIRLRYCFCLPYVQ